MRIQTAHRKSELPPWIGSESAFRRWRWGGVILYTVLLVALGVYVQDAVNLSHVRQAIYDLPRVVARAKAGMTATPEQLFIHIKFRHYEKLQYQRDRALARGILIVNDDDYVPATIEYRGKSIPVRIRLKGDDIDDHLYGEKWSFRIKTRGENTLMGMKQLSIHHPQARNYVYEWIYHQALQREDVVGLRYAFVRVNLNGKDLGIYALEEHFEKRLIEHNQRREGPIVRFDEGPAWEELAQQRFPGAKPNGVGTYFVTGIDAFQTQQWLLDPQPRAVHDRAISLLAAFRSGKRKTSEVFDTDRLASYLAISDLVGAAHGSEWKNVRFYYNPITSRLEPIGFDGVGWRPSEGLSYMLREYHPTGAGAALIDTQFYQDVFSDPVFLRRYMQKLEEVSQPGYLHDLFAEIDETLERNLAILYSEFRRMEFSREILFRNQRYIQQVLHPEESLIVYAEPTSADKFSLQVGNPLGVPVELVELSSGARKLHTFRPETLLPGKTEFSIIQFHPFTLTLSDSAQLPKPPLESLQVRYRILGASTLREAKVQSWPYPAATHQEMALLRDHPNAHEFDFLIQNTASRQVRIKPGTWTLSRDLIVPAGYTFCSSGDVTLNLTSSASIISFSPLQFTGREDGPIVIESLDGTGRGLRVVAAEEPSILTHVIFRELTNSSDVEPLSAGAVVFDRSPVTFESCSFLNIQNENAVHLLHSPFVLSRSTLSGCQGNGIRVAFCDGTIQIAQLTDCGNGIHLLNGSVELKNGFLTQLRESGLEIGANGRMVSRKTTIAHAQTGVIVKDTSFLKARGLTITDCRVGLSVLQSKREFGPASGDLSGVKMKSVQLPYQLKNGSTLKVEGVAVAPNQ